MERAEQVWSFGWRQRHWVRCHSRLVQLAQQQVVVVAAEVEERLLQSGKLMGPSLVQSRQVFCRATNLKSGRVSDLYGPHLLRVKSLA